MADREIHTHTTTGGSSGIGLVGVVIGAVLVLGAIFFFAGGPAWFGGDGDGGTQVTIEQGAPGSSGGSSTSGSAGSSGPATSGSAPPQSGSAPAPSGPASNQ